MAASALWGISCVEPCDAQSRWPSTTTAPARRAATPRGQAPPNKIKAMLLRVRIPSGGTVKLRIEPTLSYAQAIEQVAREAGLPPDGLSFSLNKRESLPALPAAAISSLGLTSGDLVYLIDASAPPPPAPAPAPAHTPTQAITALPSRPSPSAPRHRAARVPPLLPRQLHRRPHPPPPPSPSSARWASPRIVRARPLCAPAITWSVRSTS